MQKILQRLIGNVYQEQLLIYIEKIQLTIETKTEFSSVYVEFSRRNYMDRTECLEIRQTKDRRPLSFKKNFIKHSQFYKDKNTNYPSYQEKKITLQVFGLGQKGWELLGKKSIDISNNVGRVRQDFSLELESKENQVNLRLSVSVISADEESKLGLNFNDLVTSPNL